MMPVVSRSQVQVGDVRVDLRRRDVTVSEQPLHRTRISAVLQQVRRKAVSQGVRRNIPDADFFCMPLDHGPCDLSCERKAAIQKHERGSSFAISGLHCRILLQPVNGALAERYAAFLVSFSMTDDK